jgi:hypothetical protein
MIRGFNVDPYEFVELLEALPDGAAEIRASLMGAFGVLVTGHNYQDMWQSVVHARGEDGAADVVSELVLAKGGERVRKLIQGAAELDGVYVRADDPPLVRLLFDNQGDPSYVGEYVADYANRSGWFIDESETDSDDRLSDENEMEDTITWDTHHRGFPATMWSHS